MAWLMQPMLNDPYAPNVLAVTKPSVDMENEKRVRILLNGIALLLDVRGSVEKIVGTLTHEMIVSTIFGIGVILNADADIPFCCLACLLLPRGKHA